MPVINTLLAKAACPTRNRAKPGRWENPLVQDRLTRLPAKHRRGWSHRFIGNHLLTRLQRLDPVTALVHAGFRLAVQGVRTVAADVTKASSIRVGGAELLLNMAAIS